MTIEQELKIKAHKQLLQDLKALVGLLDKLSEHHRKAKSEYAADGNKINAGLNEAQETSVTLVNTKLRELIRKYE